MQNHYSFTMIPRDKFNQTFDDKYVDLCIVYESLLDRDGKEFTRYEVVCNCIPGSSKIGIVSYSEVKELLREAWNPKPADAGPA